MTDRLIFTVHAQTASEANERAKEYLLDEWGTGEGAIIDISHSSRYCLGDDHEFRVTAEVPV